MAEEPKLKWEARITLGNALTIAVMILGGAGVFVRMEVGDARQDERITSQGMRIQSLENAAFRLSSDTNVKLDQINTRLSTIEGFLRRSGLSTP